MLKKYIFISSVQREFAKERGQLCSYIRQDALLGRFFEPFLFEELPAINASAEQAYLSEIASSDIYLGIIGNQYGFQDYEGISPTEREFDEATVLEKYRICFFKTSSPQTEREPKQQLFKNPQRFFQTSEIKCAQFYGNEVTKPIPSYHVYQGDLFSLINQAVDFIMSRINARVGTRDKSVQAPIDFEFPLEAVREAIVNSVSHRDYTSNASVQVMLFKNRLEVWNPGHLPPGITIEQLYQVHESFPTNPLIANPLYLAGYAERLGTGTSDIIKKCVTIGLKPPTFSQSHNFRTTFWRNEEIEEANPITSEPNPTTFETNPTSSIVIDAPNKANVTSSIANMTSSEANPITSIVKDATSKVNMTTSEANVTTSEAIDRANDRVNDRANLNEKQKAVLAFCEKPRSSREILNHISIKYHPDAIKQYIHSLIKANLLKMTIPDKPNHPEQGYITTDEYAKEQ